MHNYIFELSSTAIPEDERYSIFDIPDWFKGSIADAAYDTAGEERELAIAGLIKGIASSTPAAAPSRKPASVSPTVTRM